MPGPNANGGPTTPDDAALVDLVCGPASPLPETYQRYRLVARLGSGGQADVYRGVRLSGGVTSAPITVKVFRVDPTRPLADELRSWDKGDAVLMDLNNRGVPGICRRADGFYGPPPHPIGGTPNLRDAVPYQIYDYLHGINLREYVNGRAGFTAGARLSAPLALHRLADTLAALHNPTDLGACPVLHMDVKPSNIMALANGDVRLIDFTGARYFRHEEITQIAYTPESGGPEALAGQVGPSYDVHGFGAVAFFLLTGSAPRGQSAPPMGRNPLFEGRPALRDHVLATLADKPGDRPQTAELGAWIDRLAALVRAAGVPDLGVDWAEPKPAEAKQPAVGRARPVLAGTETEAFSRIEMLERELVALRGVLPAGAEAQRPLVPLPIPEPVAPVPQGDRSMLVGRAPVVPRQPAEPTDAAYGLGESSPPKPALARVRGAKRRELQEGGTWSVAGISFAILCWIIWAAGQRARGLYVAPAALVGTLAVAVGVFVVLRLLGRMIIEGWMHRKRRSALASHIGVAIFLMVVGITYLEQTTWIAKAFSWVKGLF